MMKVQNQKHGQGGHALDFLNEPSKKPAAMQADEDLGFDEMQMRILEDTEQEVNRRDEEITKIAKSIEELAAIFKELAVLVIDQGMCLSYKFDFPSTQSRVFGAPKPYNCAC